MLRSIKNGNPVDNHMTPNPAVNTDAPPKSRRSAGYLERYALKQMPFRQHALVQDADNFNNTVGG